jgi:hypothetical protein
LSEVGGKDIVTWWLKAGIVEPQKASNARQ